MINWIYVLNPSLTTFAVKGMHFPHTIDMDLMMGLALTSGILAGVKQVEVLNVLIWFDLTSWTYIIHPDKKMPSVALAQEWRKGDLHQPKVGSQIQLTCCLNILTSQRPWREGKLTFVSMATEMLELFALLEENLSNKLSDTWWMK